MSKKYGVIQLIVKAGELDCSHCSDKELKVLKERPIVYIYYCKNSFYVGQTNQLKVRHDQHMKETKRNYAVFTNLIVLFGQFVDGNSQNDLERLLITYLTADSETLPEHEKRISLNRTQGNKVCDYPTKAEVRAEVIVPFWEDELRQAGLVHELSLEQLRNSILFKYSPFTELSQKQSDIIEDILHERGNHIVQGGAGTGKTVLLTNLVARLSTDCAAHGLRVGIVLKANWIESANRIFKAYGIQANITVGSAYHFIKDDEHYDIIIVDEAHRLRWNYPKQNHLQFDIFDKNDPLKNELYLLGQKTDRMILLYDALQAIRPADIPRIHFERYVKEHCFCTSTLSAQFRVQLNDDGATYTADDYLNGIKQFLQLENNEYYRRVFQNKSPDAYFGVVNSISDLFAYTDQQRQYYPAAKCYVLAGCARRWGSHLKVSSKNYTLYDWKEGGNQWRWNSTHKDWINLQDSENEIGCIHAVQGVDIDYVGLVIGKDITFVNGKVTAVKENYFDQYGAPVLKNFSNDELTEYLKQIYYVLLSRGISGIRIYIEDNELRNHFEKEAGLI